MGFAFDPDDISPRVVATIGVFDGVHRGHQALISSVRTRAKELGVRSMVVTFDPHPVVVLASHLPPQRLGARPVEERWLRDTGVDQVWFIPFSEAISEWPAEQFLTYLTDHLDLCELWIGYDFRFGKDRAGDAEFLRAHSADRGFQLRVFEAVATDSPLAPEDSGRIFSSTWVRELLAEGKVARAADVLGHAFEVQGKVIRGQGLGARDLVPTANLELRPEQVLPRNGIYVGWAAIEMEANGEGWIPAVANVGCRPTVENDGQTIVEIHVIDWNKDIYGQNLKFRFGDWIRAEEKFEGLSALRAAIDRDVQQARAWFRTRSD